MFILVAMLLVLLVEMFFAAGTGNDDEWFFDYQSGVLHFVGENLPNGVDFTLERVYTSLAQDMLVRLDLVELQVVTSLTSVTLLIPQTILWETPIPEQTLFDGGVGIDTTSQLVVVSLFRSNLTLLVL